MLGRTANNIYWMARYVERAENMARLLASTYHMSLLPASDRNGVRQWEAPIDIVGGRDDFLARHGEVTSANVIHFVALDPDNPNSIRSNIRRARDNARATRQDLTSEVWESLNQSYIDIENLSYPRIVDQGFPEIFDWVKERSHLFRGAIYGTMRRGQAFTFCRLGTFIERADNTARLLSVKWTLLTPNGTKPMAAEDYYRWGSLLRAFAAFKAYREVYSGIIEPRKVAELLVLRADMPRSLTACVSEVARILVNLRRDAPCTRLAEQMQARMRHSRIDSILRSDIRRYLNDFVVRNNELHGKIGHEFMMV
ncbi:MAG: alpha-E domain-containing protein [Rhodospirillales bacterium]|nr:MAG: alpha-E domain-containing protein [Rhodospirillales bacterium]